MPAVQPQLTVAPEPYTGADAQALVVAMAEDLSALYGPAAYPASTEAEWTAPHGCFVLARLGGRGVGCAGWRRFDEQTVELKRVFVVPSARGRGVARALLLHLEARAWEQGYRRAVLETGVLQEPALRLYRGLGWTPTACWPPYADDPSSRCFSKLLEPPVAPPRAGPQTVGMGEATTSAEHGDALYRTKAPEEVSWFQADPATSERLIRALARPSDGVVDVGAGASRLADVLLTAGWSDVTLLDVSHEALELVRGRLSGRAGASFVVADVLSWRPGRTFRVWHDRAVFPFLGEPRAQQAYVEVAGGAVEPGGAAVIATFAADGPTVCSGLPTARYGAAELGARFGSAFLLEHAEREEHVTPWGAVQAFTWVVLRRTADG